MIPSSGIKNKDTEKKKMRSKSIGMPLALNSTLMADQLSYNGPVRLPKSKNAVTSTIVNHSQYFVVSSSVGGVMNNIFLADPSATAGWSSLAAEWAEFRVLAFQVEFTPTQKYTTGQCHLFVTSVDHGNVSSTIGSYSSAVDRESSVSHNTQESFIVKAKATGTEELEYLPTGSPAARYCIKTYGEGSISTQYFQTVVRYLIELRGQQ